MGAIVVATLQSLFDALKNPASGGNDTEGLYLASIEIYALVGEIARAVVFIFGQVAGAKIYEQPFAELIGHDFEAIQGANQNSMDHIAFTILPNSLNYLLGYIYSDAITPLRAVTKLIADRVTALQQRLAADENWLYNWVVPGVKDYYAFREAFYKGDQPSINVLIDWLKQPGDFGVWAAAPITGPLIAYLADAAHKQSRDNLASVMVGAWQDEPVKILDGIMTWLVTNDG